MQLDRLYTTSKEYSGDTVFAENRNRGYFFIVMTTGTGTIEFGNGGGKIPLPATGYYSPHIAPTSAISIETNGTFVVHSDKHL